MRPISLLIFLLLSIVVSAQSKVFTKEDTLLGSNHQYRAWWDVKHYHLSIKPDFKEKSISGYNIITYKVVSDSLPFVMQLDLQSPLLIDSIFFNRTKINDFKKVANRWMLQLPPQKKKSENYIQVFYHGKPTIAKNPPWDGGWVWKKDSLGNPWMSVACQGAGASVWYPCKDLQSDESDEGALIEIHVPDTLTAIGNGQLISKHINQKGWMSYLWRITHSINNYNIIPYIGKYTLLHDSIEGEKGKLMTDYWVLNYHKQKAIQHLKPNVIKTIKCFEYWFGPYPFYEDFYKIVEAPYLGMEHQSNIAYGNYYLNGYAGRDLSNTGWGLKWDFIVVHESGHEWFGNNITASDVADNWIHEGFTSYSEVLFTECEFGKEAGNDYCEGVKKSINNDIPIIGKYDVHQEGSGDMYNKGSQVVHMIRQVINDDEKFRLLLREMNRTFYHQTVSTKELELFINEKTGINFIPFFNQYLRTTQIPMLQYKIKKNKLSFRYTNCLTEFNMPVKIKTDKEFIITPTTQWQTISLEKKTKTISLDRNVYVKLEKGK
ncbi:MAG: M1 family metallopeptidase [Bacteroidia bacterium]|nr:M1 family metallopeptidase [Bacteroidia bacterium]